MARTIRDAKLDSRRARERLAVSAKPVFRQLEHGRAIGYRKTADGGAWIGRMYVGARKYAEQRLGSADDILDADGVDVLDWAQAQAAARAWFDVKTRQLSGADVADKPYTVAAAAADYMEWFAANRKSAADTRIAVDAHIVAKLGDHQVAKLTTTLLRRWLKDLAESPKRLRRKKTDDKPRFAAPPTSEEDVRRRRSTANRVLTILKALLNQASEEERVKGVDPKVWGNLKAFGEADAARVRCLEPAEAVRLANACGPDFRKMVRAGLHTGARYGELARLKVADYRSGKLFVAKSKSAKARWISLDTAGKAFLDAVTVGRSGEDFVFKREDGSRWGKSYQIRPIKEACRQGSVTPPCTFHELRHTYASLALMAGMPMMVLAENLGHTDTRMVEKHYGHLIESYRDRMVEQFAPKFDFDGDAGGGTVVKMIG